MGSQARPPTTATPAPSVTSLPVRHQASAAPSRPFRPAARGPITAAARRELGGGGCLATGTGDERLLYRSTYAERFSSSAKGMFALTALLSLAPSSRLRCSRCTTRTSGARQSFGSREHPPAPVADAGSKHPRRRPPRAGFSLPTRIGTRGTPAPLRGGQERGSLKPLRRGPRVGVGEKGGGECSRGDLGGGPAPRGCGGRRGGVGLAAGKCEAPGSRPRPMAAADRQVEAAPASCRRQQDSSRSSTGVGQAAALPDREVCSRRRCSRWAACRSGARQSFGSRQDLPAPAADAGSKRPAGVPRASVPRRRFGSAQGGRRRPFDETRWERMSQTLCAEVPAAALLKEAELLTRGDLGGGPAPRGCGGRRGGVGLAAGKCGAPGSRLRPMAAADRQVEAAPASCWRQQDSSRSSTGVGQTAALPVAKSAPGDGVRVGLLVGRAPGNPSGRAKIWRRPPPRPGVSVPPASPEGGFLDADSDRHKGAAGARSTRPGGRGCRKPFAPRSPRRALLKEAELLTRGDLGGGPAPRGCGGRRGDVGLAAGKCGAPGSRLRPMAAADRQVEAAPASCWRQQDSSRSSTASAASRAARPRSRLAARVFALGCL
jgi:hypothetical protein